MRAVVVFVTVHVISICCAVSLDLFKWPSFKNRTPILPNPLESIARLRTKTVRKIERRIDGFKSRVEDLKTTLLNGKPSGYPSESPSSYKGGSGYIKIVRHLPTALGAPPPSKEGNEKPAQASLSSHSEPSVKEHLHQIGYQLNGEVVSKSPGFNSLKYDSKSKQHPPEPNPTTNSDTPAHYETTLPPNSKKTSEYEINAPVSAAMTVGSLENNITDVQVLAGKWKPLPPNKGTSKTVTPTMRGGKKLGLILKSTKESRDSQKAEPREFGDALKSDNVKRVNEGILKGGKALSHILDFTLDSFPNDNSLNDQNDHLTKDFTNHNQKLPKEQSLINSLEMDLATSFPTFISSGLHQEDIANIDQINENFSLPHQNQREKDNLSIASSPKDLFAGQRKNMMFGSLLEELKLNIFLTLIRRANLDPMITTKGDFTIFAPTDSAFKMIPRSVFAKLEDNTESLRKVILFHVVPGQVGLQDIRNEMVLASAAPGERMLRLNIYDFGSDLQPIVTVNGARLKHPDNAGSNVILHVIDKVLYPMTEDSIMEHLTSCDIFKGANVAVRSSQLTSVLEQEGPFTFFVPSTEGFALIDNATVNEFISNVSLLQDVLLFHIVPGTFYSEGLRDNTWLPTLLPRTEVQVRVTSDGISRRLSGVGRHARVLKADIPAKNGVIHVLDLVLQPGMEKPVCGHF